MVKVYAISLVVGVVGLLIVILGGALSENLGREEGDPGRRYDGMTAKTVIGALIGFGMGGLSAEFSPLDLVWPVALIIASAAGLLAVFWVRYAVRQYET